MGIGRTEQAGKRLYSSPNRSLDCDVFLTQGFCFPPPYFSGYCCPRLSGSLTRSGPTLSFNLFGSGLFLQDKGKLPPT